MKKEEITEEVKQKTLDELNVTEEQVELPTVTEDGKPITKVTSIAEEEERTGQKIEIPTADKLVANASVAILQTRRGIYQTFGKMSKKASLRALTAIFSMPEDGIPVELNTDEEKMAYALAQRHMMARFTVMQHHVNLERLKRMEEAKAEVEKIDDKIADLIEEEVSAIIEDNDSPQPQGESNE